ncbi:hypothetical protein MVEG_01305 [Podila verticillata NRRL 6337]|nr:hypothetical protein MVEG_01305 [Podila verticillata NRRL 6337]
MTTSGGNQGQAGDGDLYRQSLRSCIFSQGYIHWDGRLSDYSATFLNMITQHNPSILRSFTLDISCLSLATFTIVQNVLSRSNLVNIHVSCTPFDPCLSESISQVLHSVRWGYLKSLVFSGDNIDAWMRLQSFVDSPHLLCLEIHGSGSAQQPLSHSSVLFIHQLVYSSSLMDFHIDGIQLQDKYDLELIVQSMEPSLLKTFSMGSSTTVQLLSNTDALNHFVSNTKDRMVEARRAALVLTSFDLDIVPTLPKDFVHIQNLLRLSRLERLCIICAYFDPRLSASVVQVHQSVQWSSLKSLVLFGSNIDTWIQLISTIVSPRLQSLSVCGTKSTSQNLSHSSILYIQRLFDVNPLLRLKFENILLRHKYDWVHLIKSMDSSLLVTLDLCSTSSDDLMLSTDAVDFFVSKVNVVCQEGLNAVEDLASLTLGILPLSPHGLVKAFKTLYRSKLDHLRIVCNVFDSRLSNSISQVLQAVHWSTLVALVLSGDNINNWTQILSNAAPRLEQLRLCGTGDTTQVLSPSSVRSLHHLIRRSELKELKMENVRLWNTHDWELLLHFLRPLGLQNLDLCEASRRQFLLAIERQGLYMWWLEKVKR